MLPGDTQFPWDCRVQVSFLAKGAARLLCWSTRGVGDEIGLFSFALFYCVWGGFFILAVRVGIKDGEVPSHKP